MIPDSTKHVIAAVLLAILTVGAFSVPLNASERLNLVSLATQEERQQGIAVWLATFAVCSVVVAAAAWFLAPIRVVIYAIGSLAAILASAVILINFSDFGGAFLAVGGSVFGEFACLAGARNAQLRSKSLLFVGVWLLGGILAATLLFGFTWALAFFE